MPVSQVEMFLGGMVAMGFLVAGAFFIRFWRQARDDLFLAFALAFWLMAANQIVSHLVYGVEESRGQAYVLRLGAFLLIAAAVVRKNAGDRRRR
jgi:hypothetical protein